VHGNKNLGLLAPHPLKKIKNLTLRGTNVDRRREVNACDCQEREREREKREERIERREREERPPTVVELNCKHVMKTGFFFHPKFSKECSQLSWRSSIN
jgi:hypothetical protein